MKPHKDPAPVDLAAIRGWWEAVYADGTEFAEEEAARLLAAVPSLCDELERYRRFEAEVRAWLDAPIQIGTRAELRRSLAAVTTDVTWRTTTEDT